MKSEDKRPSCSFFLLMLPPKKKGDSLQRLGVVANSGSKNLGFPTGIHISCHAIFLNSGS